MDGIPGVPTLEDVRNASLIISIEKRCPKCQKRKSVREFGLCKKSKDGRRGWCKKCDYKISKRWRDANLEKAREATRQWVKANPEKCREAERRRRKINPEKHNERVKCWNKANPERARKIRQKSNAKRYNTLKGKLTDNIRNSVRNSLKGSKKGRHWENLLGFTVEQFKEHFEKQFNDGMNWNKFMKGEIHIDHIVPVSAFNFKKPEDIDFKKAWTLKNLQPLWAPENLKKGNKLSKPFQPSFIFE